MTPKELKQLNKKIDAEWARQGNRVQVALLAIPKIFAEARAAVANGQTVEDAVAACVAKYREN